MTRPRRYDPRATGAICCFCRRRLDHDMYPYCDHHLPLFHPARPSFQLLTRSRVVGIDELDLASVESCARHEAARCGLRPRHQLVFVATIEDYLDLVAGDGESDRRRKDAIRGLCGRTGDGRRVIFVAPASGSAALETLSHELAHGLLPWRDGHTQRWLQLHVAIAGRLYGPAFARRCLRAAQRQYALPCPQPTNQDPLVGAAAPAAPTRR